MGYTHYWYRKENLSREKFRLAIKDIRKIRKFTEPEIQFEYDDSKLPIFNDKLIRFNGCGDNGHETFYIKKKHVTDFPQKDDSDRDFAFCKTAYKPYDTFVCCCLIILNHYFGDDFVVSSDGNIEIKSDEYEWSNAIEICSEVLGYGSKFQLEG